jgi:hypothetical protein
LIDTAFIDKAFAATGPVGAHGDGDVMAPRNVLPRPESLDTLPFAEQNASAGGVCVGEQLVAEEAGVPFILAAPFR